MKNIKSGAPSKAAPFFVASSYVFWQIEPAMKGCIIPSIKFVSIMLYDRKSIILQYKIPIFVFLEVQKHVDFMFSCV